MSTPFTPRTSSDDPRRLRDLFARVGSLACEHSVPCVIVGLAGREGDLLMPEFIGYIESSLRMEDAIFWMTRERAVLFVADVDRSRAEDIVERLLQDFLARFPCAREFDVELGYFEVKPGGAQELSVKQVLPAVFGVTPAAES